MPQMLKIVGGNTCVVVLPHSKKSTEVSATQNNKQAETSLHVMAAVALSELASASNSTLGHSRSRIHNSTQTESSPDEWLNLESEDLCTNIKVINWLEKRKPFRILFDFPLDPQLWDTDG